MRESTAGMSVAERRSGTRPAENWPAARNSRPCPIRPRPPATRYRDRSPRHRNNRRPPDAKLSLDPQTTNHPVQAGAAAADSAECAAPRRVPLRCAAWRAPLRAAARSRAPSKLRSPASAAAHDYRPPDRPHHARIHVKDARVGLPQREHLVALAAQVHTHQRNADHAAQFEIGDRVAGRALVPARPDRTTWRTDRGGFRAPLDQAPRHAQFVRRQDRPPPLARALRTCSSCASSNSSRKPRSAPVTASAASTTVFRTSSVEKELCSERATSSTARSFSRFALSPVRPVSAAIRALPAARCSSSPPRVK